MPAPVLDPVLDALGPARRRAEVELILGAGAFDAEFYEAQTGLSFDSAQAACLHYLRKGRRAGCAPHPMFEPAVAQPGRWRSGGADPLVDNLRGRVQRGHGVHLALPSDWAEPVGTGLPRWLEWVRAADASSVLPVPGAPVTWGEFRARSIEYAREARHRTELATSRLRLTPSRPRVDPDLDHVALPPHDPAAPLVSVVMPTWNRAGMIRRAVESVRAQTLADWELIVVDDGSDDDTLLVLEGVTRHDPRIVVIAAPHGGVCRARNAGIAAARGQYLAFLDSDNVWNPDFLRRSVAFLSAEDAQWAHAAMQLERGPHTFYRALEGDAEHLLAGNYIDLNVTIARRQSVVDVGGFDETLRRAVDYDLVLKLARVAAPRLVPTIGSVYADHADVERISTTEPYGWNEVVTLRHATRTIDTPAEVAGRISVIIATKEPLLDFVPRLDAMLADRADVEVILVAGAVQDAFVRGAQVLALTRPRLTVVPWPSDSLRFSALVDLGASMASGEYLVAWEPNHVARPGWADALVAALDAPGVALAQPLVLDEDDLIATAGAVFAERDVTPAALLGAMPVEDVRGLGDAGVATVPAALSGVVAMRTRDFRGLGGLDPLFGNTYAEVDLALRARATGLGDAVVATGARVVRTEPDHGFPPDPVTSVRLLRERHHDRPDSAPVLATLGLEQVGRRTVLLEPELTAELTPDVVPDGDPHAPRGAVPIVRPRLDGLLESPPRLRWALDTAAPPGSRGRGWGDVHFAGSLAAALRRLGQDVHVDRRTVRDGAHRDHDDVVVALRGLDLVAPQPGAVSILWIISHPDLVTARECAAHDAVFAASTYWSSWATSRWGVDVQPLLQCTDAELFRPDAAEPDSGEELVFVGNSRKVYRSSVQYAVQNGAAPAVWGHGWETMLPDGLLRGDYYPNAELPALYASVGAVLNDHWDDMRSEGFVSNRVFDVLASGGRLITDEVAGMSELLGSCAAVFRSRADMAEILAGSWRERFPDHAARVRTAEQIRREHSFDARAAVLLDTVLKRRCA